MGPVAQGPSRIGLGAIPSQSWGPKTEKKSLFLLLFRKKAIFDPKKGPKK